MRGLTLLAIGVLWLAGVCRAAPPSACRAQEGRNGSALCLQLSVEKGQIAVASYQFGANESYRQRMALADGFIAEARLEIAKLTKPCALVMSSAQWKRHNQNPGADPAASRLCNGDFEWAAFATGLQNWADSIGRGSAAVAALAENGAFRPLVSLSKRSPLIWIQTSNQSLDSENGIVTLLIADPLDPRTEATLQIVIDGLPDGAVKEERIARLRRQLNSFWSRVFCHRRIREEVSRFYAAIGVTAQIVQLDSQGPLVEIREQAP